MSGKHGRKLLNFSIKDQLQLRLLVKVLGIVVIGIGIMAAVFYFYSNREISDSYRQFHVQAKNFLDYLWPAVFSSLVLAIVAAVAITLFLPHTIAGPLYRIEKGLKEKISRGDLTVKFILRKGDDVADLADAVNMTTDSLRQKIKKVMKLAAQLQSLIDSMEGKGDSEVARLSNELNEALKKFKIQ
jgi:methyl-accepting chemotaxis protein